MTTFVERRPKRLERCQSPKAQHENCRDREPVKFCTNLELREGGTTAVVPSRIIGILSKTAEQSLNEPNPKGKPEAKESP
jgi:hypothetical protein